MAEIRRIYRVEHHNSERGPYTCRENWSDKLRDMEGRHNCSRLDHPVPMFMSKMHHPASGFMSLIHLHHWFDDDELAMMFDLGFVVVEIEIDADSVRYLEKQVLFKPDGIISKKTLDMSLEICYTLQS
ncbi:hypothetical protein KAR91_39085 [Candidatus Pacearchaeota archaeon]|nr:hypothetical protein [Candidatus Pacearchaeota archaeon]